MPNRREHALLQRVGHKRSRILSAVPAPPRTLEPAGAPAAEALALERTLSDLVNQAYGLTPAQIDLMWQTAPPRIPLPQPAGS